MQLMQEGYTLDVMALEQLFSYVVLSSPSLPCPHARFPASDPVHQSWVDHLPFLFFSSLFFSLSSSLASPESFCAKRRGRVRLEAAFMGVEDDIWGSAGLLSIGRLSDSSILM